MSTVKIYIKNKKKNHSLYLYIQAIDIFFLVFNVNLYYSQSIYLDIRNFLNGIFFVKKKISKKINTINICRSDNSWRNNHRNGNKTNRILKASPVDDPAAMYGLPNGGTEWAYAISRRRDARVYRTGSSSLPPETARNRPNRGSVKFLRIYGYTSVIFLEKKKM